MAYDVFDLSETWLSYETTNNSISIENYKIFRHDRGFRSSGLTFYIKVINSKIVEVGSAESDLEHLWLSVTVHGKKIGLGTTYRLPNSNLASCVDCLERILIDLIPQFDILLFGGDFNIDRICRSVDSTLMYTFFCKYQLKQCIAEPTRITASAGTLIDLMFCGIPAVVADVSMLGMDKISDHRIVCCFLKIPRRNYLPFIKMYRGFSEFDVDAFCVYLDQINLDYLYSLTNIDQMVHFVSSNILTLFDVHAQLKKVRISKSPASWMTDNLKLMIRLKRKAFYLSL